MQRILVSWIGKADLDACQHSREDLFAEGPVLAALKAERFVSAHFLCNYAPDELKAYLEWLRRQVVIPCDAKQVKLSSPIDFAEIYQAAEAHLGRITAAHRQAQLCLLLSPGTPAMQAVWILLGKTRFPAAFLQSSREQGVQFVDIPFDITADFIPQIAAHRDAAMCALSAQEFEQQAGFHDIQTQDATMRELIARADVMAKREVPVLIQGETGTGKELFATAIHNASARQGKPLVAVNCGAIPPELIDATLFGHLKGAFTGATKDKAGYFEAAEGGTLFLDELGELPLDAQVRLLRVLQTGDYLPVGATTAKRANVRIIAATHRNLVEEVAAGRFREDLFYRIAVGVLSLPPLRERPSDLPLLARTLLEQINRDAAGQPGFIMKQLTEDAIDRIQRHSWPGNVRELYSTLLRASLWSTNKWIDEMDIDAALFRSAGKSAGILDRELRDGFSIKGVFDEVARHYLPRALDEAAGNRTQAAKLLGLGNYQTLKNWMERHGIDY